MKTKKDFGASEWRELEGAVGVLTGCRFKNKDLLRQAFVRSSYSMRYGGENNEKLEFFGDAILEFYVRKALAEKYGYVRTSQNASFDGDCEYAFRGTARDFTEIKQRLVSNGTLAGIIDRRDLARFLIVDKGDLGDPSDAHTKMKADLFEAILGAVAIQFRWAPDILEKTVERMLSLNALLEQHPISDPFPADVTLDNAVSQLKEMAEHGRAPVPLYEFHGPDELGHDENGAPIWACTCSVADWGIIRQVWTSSKKDAKRCAAYLVLCERYQLENKYGPNKRCSVWTCRGGRLLTPIS